MVGIVEGVVSTPSEGTRGRVDGSSSVDRGWYYHHSRLRDRYCNSNTPVVSYRSCPRHTGHWSPIKNR